MIEKIFLTSQNNFFPAARTNSFEAHFADILYNVALHLPVRTDTIFSVQNRT